MFSPTLTIFLNLCLAALTFAAPLSNEKLTTMGNAQQMGAGGGVLCFAVLILDILVWGTRIPIVRSVCCADTMANSRSNQIHAPTQPQAAVVCSRLPLACRWADTLLCFLGPREA